MQCPTVEYATKPTLPAHSSKCSVKWRDEQYRANDRGSKRAWWYRMKHPATKMQQDKVCGRQTACCRRYHGKQNTLRITGAVEIQLDRKEYLRNPHQEHKGGEHHVSL